jgi:hypothetical protein
MFDLFTCPFSLTFFLTMPLFVIFLLFWLTPSSSYRFSSLPSWWPLHAPAT